MELSARRLKTYLACPRKFKFEYVENIPVPTTGSLAFGKTIHSVIEQLYMEQKMDADYAVQLFSQQWDKVLETEQPYFTDQRWTPEKYAALGQEILKGYVAKHHDKLPPLLVEFEFALPFGEHIIRGVVDRIDEGKAGLVVVDFKTDKVKPTQAELDIDLQFTVYAWAISQLFGQPVEKCIHYQLRKNEELVTHRDLAHCEELLTEVVPYVVQNIEAELFPPNRGLHCRWCPFAFLCEQDPLWQKQSPLGGNLEVMTVSEKSLKELVTIP